ncbi:hypothetical protein Avbf_18403 [Armadillidium vulgare]|nr:hypothetical protein Avbf_18403 [Armadillidium vulgare]
MQEAFVIHVQNPEDVLVTISRKKETFPNVLSMQPLQRKDLLNIAQIIRRIEGHYIKEKEKTIGLMVKDLSDEDSNLKSLNVMDDEISNEFESFS